MATPRWKTLPTSQLYLDFLSVNSISKEGYFFLPGSKKAAKAALQNAFDSEDQLSNLMHADKNGNVCWGWAHKRPDVDKPLTWAQWDRFINRIISRSPKASSSREKHFDVAVAVTELKDSADRVYAGESLLFDEMVLVLYYSETWFKKGTTKKGASSADEEEHDDDLEE